MHFFPQHCICCTQVLESVCDPCCFWLWSTRRQRKLPPAKYQTCCTQSACSLVSTKRPHHNLLPSHSCHVKYCVLANYNTTMPPCDSCSCQHTHNTFWHTALQDHGPLSHGLARRGRLRTHQQHVSSSGYLTEMWLYQWHQSATETWSWCSPVFMLTSWAEKPWCVTCELTSFPADTDLESINYTIKGPHCLLSTLKSVCVVCLVFCWLCSDVIW